MNQQSSSPSILQQAATSHQLPPVYLDDLTKTIGVLQQLQVLCSARQGDVSLANVIHVVHQMQYEFGEQSHLEQVIQNLVGRNLKRQMLARRLAHQQHTEAREVLV
jgi:hypothetical protein